MKLSLWIEKREKKKIKLNMWQSIVLRQEVKSAVRAGYDGIVKPIKDLDDLIKCVNWCKRENLSYARIFENSISIYWVYALPEDNKNYKYLFPVGKHPLSLVENRHSPFGVGNKK
ncbi:hypothetical protein [Liquorilactobacillus hordei]|nr:hypothetical protein [Liquorilactobacillus hordei]QYH51091.1 hypothetical protein G6O70_00585 [Liquorilactobacillus hordei DSM 19519]